MFDYTKLIEWCDKTLSKKIYNDSFIVLVLGIITEMPGEIKTTSKKYIFRILQQWLKVTMLKWITLKRRKKKHRDYPIERFEITSEDSVSDDIISSNPHICFIHLLWKLLLITLIRAISSCSQLLNSFSSILATSSFENTVNYRR